MMSPFHCVAEEYRKQGYSVIPLVARSKRVIIKEWSRYCTELADNDTFNHWMAWPESNIGLCLGSASGVFGLDYDIDRSGLHKRIQSIVPASPCVKRGAKGFTAFYRFEGQRSAGYKHDGVTVIDILAGGKQTVIPPSRHPDGMDYEWDGLSLLQVAREDLPSITAAQMADIGRLFKTHEPRQMPSDFNFDSDADIDTALQYVRADDYHTWVRMGMAIKDHLGDAGYGLWDGWSSRGSNYKGGGETRKKWQSFKSQGISVATVFYEAMQAGFKPKPQPLPERFKVIESGGNMVIENKPNESFSFLDNIPGLPGLIAEHINATAGYAQPLLALGAALATAGAIMGNRVETETRLRTNIYALGLGESSGGKDHARKCCKVLLNECTIGYMEMGVPKSGAALVSSLHKRNGVGVAYIDEFGHFFNKLTGKNTASHEREITALLLELYSTAGSVFAGPEYANHDGKTPAKTIVNPCLSLYPVTTPKKFYSTLTSSDVLDGFISRFLVFESYDFPIEWQQVRKMHDVPDSLRESIDMWLERAKPDGNMPGGDLSTIMVPFDIEAREIFKEYSYTTRTKAKAVIKDGNHAIYGRLAENAMRLALIAHEGSAINGKVALWAISVAEHCAAIILDAIANKVSDNENERLNKEILQFVKHHKTPVSRSHLALKFRNIERRARAGLLDDLVESGALGMALDDSDAKKKAVLYFIP